jgi:hypothetical protein
LGRDGAAVDAFMNDPMCFALLQPASFASFLAAGQGLRDPMALRRISRLWSETRASLFDRTPVEPMCEGAVMDDPAAADVDTVMGKTQTRCNEVRAQRGFLAFGKASIVPTKSAAKATSVPRDFSISPHSVRVRTGTREGGNQGMARHLHSLLDWTRA